MFKIKEVYFRIIGIPLLGILLSFIFCPDPTPQLGEVIKSTLFVFVFWQGLYTIITLFRKRYPKIKQTNKRLLLTVLFSLLYLGTADLLLRNFFYYFYPELSWELDSWLMHMVKNVFISFIVAMIYEAVYFYTRWNEANLETEKYKTQQIVSQLESLKNQISPHFLFNSLNTLAAIIPENPKQAEKFTEKLSDVYRYILQYKDKELVPLKIELDFITSYLFMLKIRYPENLEIDIRIPDKQLTEHVAPLTLQILVENAIKHNVISKSDPLKIKIFVDNDHRIIVENALQLKSIAKNSTKTGLENIRKRYEFLSEKSIEIFHNQNLFKVAVPLIQFEDKA